MKQKSIQFIIIQSTQCIFLLVILMDSIYRLDKNYYPQVFLEEDKYTFGEKGIPEFHTDNIEFFSDEKNFKKENSDEGNFNE